MAYALWREQAERMDLFTAIGGGQVRHLHNLEAILEDRIGDVIYPDTDDEDYSPPERQSHPSVAEVEEGEVSLVHGVDLDAPLRDADLNDVEGEGNSKGDITILADWVRRVNSSYKDVSDRDGGEE